MQTYSAHLGDNGEIIIPQPLRERFGLHEGDRVILTATDSGILLQPQATHDDPVWRVFGRLNRGVDTDAFVIALRDE
jgi:AbrB family looped-hinge helix DNA binding protein